MVEEVDTAVGKLLDRLDETGLANNTLIVFTADHGELLGAHSMLNKGILLEEAARVPLILSYPGTLPSGKVISASTPVSHIDLFATLLDYAHASEYDESDGKSLRRYIEDASFNEFYDERAVMVELDSRFPVNRRELSDGLGEIPNFMIRKGSYKLMLPKNRDSKVIDMMYDLSTDPYEMTNLIFERKNSVVPDSIIGKAEHLKLLLLEALFRYDTDEHFYSDNKWNLGAGAGDVAEIRNRRTWREVEYWQSDLKLSFGPPVRRDDDGAYVRNEYLYLGRTAPGSMHVHEIYVTGPDASLFSVNVTTSTGGSPLGRISQGQFVRARVSFVSTDPVPSVAGLEASIVIRNSVQGYSEASIVGEE
jgi:hypothetical protein